MTETVSFEQIVEVIARRGADRRSITALVGPPGAGKSTVSERLVGALNLLSPGSAAVLPMDGYHLDDLVLVPRGLRGRKGAPETFDVSGLASMLVRLKSNEEPEIAVPVFDRDIEVARAGARMIPQTVRHLIVEGNYLLLDRAPWSALAPMFDTSVAVIEKLDVLRRRLAARWEGYGLSEAEVVAKVEGNDLINARLVLEHNRAPEFVLHCADMGGDRPSASTA